MNVEVLFIRRPDELICGEDKPFDSRLEEDLLEEWRYYEKQPLRSSAFSWKGWCMVYESEPRPACRRGYVVGVRKAGGATKYDVFLCDHGCIREVESKQILPLNPEFKKCPGRYYILNIDGIMPRNGEGWSQEALKTAKAWADVNVGQIGLQTKKVPCDSPTLSGDLRTRCPVEPFQWKTYSSYLVATGVARRRHDDDTQSKPEPRVNQRKETVSQHDKKNGRRKYKNKRSNDLNKRSDNPFVKNNSCADDSGIDHWWRTDSQSGSQDDSRSVSSDIRSDHRGQYRGGRRFERGGFSSRGRPSGGNQTWKGSNTNGHSFQEDRSFGKNFNGSGRGGYHETGRRTPVTPLSSVAFQGRGRDLGESFKSDEVVFQTKVANIPRPAILHPVVQLESKEETSERPADSKDDTEQKTERQRVNPSVSEEATASADCIKKSPSTEDCWLENESDSDLFEEGREFYEWTKELSLSEISETGKDKILNSSSTLRNIMSSESLVTSFKPKANSSKGTSNLFKRIKDPDDCFKNIYPPESSAPIRREDDCNRDSVSFAQAPVLPQNPDVTVVNLRDDNGVPHKKSGGSAKQFQPLSRSQPDVVDGAVVKKPPSLSEDSQSGSSISSGSLKFKKNDIRFGKLKDSPSNPFFTVQVQVDENQLCSMKGEEPPALVSAQTTKVKLSQQVRKSPFENKLPSWEEVQRSLRKGKAESEAPEIVQSVSAFSRSAAGGELDGKSKETSVKSAEGANNEKASEHHAKSSADNHEVEVETVANKDNETKGGRKAFQPSHILGSWEDAKKKCQSSGKAFSDASAVDARGTDEMIEKISSSPNIRHEEEPEAIVGSSAKSASNTQGDGTRLENFLVAMPSAVEDDRKQGNRSQVSKETLKKMMQGRIFCYAKDHSVVAEPYASMKDFPLLSMVEKGLKSNRVLSKTNNLQNNVIPNIVRGNNVIIADSENSGKSLAYMIPVAAKIMQVVSTAKRPMRGPCPPRAVILTGSIAQGNKLLEQFDYLLESQNFKQTTAYLVIKNDESTRDDLSKGADILITMPEVLDEMIEKYMPYFSFDSLMYFIVDDTETLMRSKVEILEKVFKKIEHGLIELGPRQNTIQNIFCGNVWSSAIEDAMDTVDSPVLFLGPIQASVFAGVKVKVNYAGNSSDKLDQFLGVMGRVVEARKMAKIIVVCKGNESVRLLQLEISKRFSVEVLTATHTSLHEDTSWCPGQIEAVRQRWEATSSPALTVVVCTDAVIKELRIVDATLVLHFDAAETPVVFAQRFSTMWRWFKTSRERQEQKLQSLISYLFLTPEEPYLARIVARLKEQGATIPDNLDEDVEQMRLECEKQERLCPDLMWYGFCDKNEQRKCKRRHMFLEKDVQLNKDVPAHGQIEVKIVRMVSLSTYYVQMLRHFEVKGWKTELVCNYEEIFQQRSEFLSKYYDNPENRVPVQLGASRGYGAIWDDGRNIYLRAQVDDMNKIRSGVENIVRLFCVDTGNFMHRPLDQIYALPVGYDALPDLVVELIVASMKPPLGESTYLLSHWRKAHKLTENFVFVGRICLTLGRRIWVDTLKEMTPNKWGRQVVKRSLRRQFFDLKFAEDNPDHMKNLYVLCEKAGLSCKQYEVASRDEFGLAFYNQFYQKDHSIQWAHLQISTEESPVTVTVWSSYVMDADRVACYHDSFTKQLDDLKEDMNIEIEEMVTSKKYINSSILHQYFDSGMAVAVKDPVTEKWERATITGIDSDSEAKPVFHVYLADVGEELYAVEMSFLHPIPSKFVERLPFQAITMKVSHVMPTEAEEGERIWTNGAQELTESLVLDANAKAKLLEVSAYRKLQPCDSLYGNEYCALIFVGRDEIGEKLVQENFACVSEHESEMVERVKSGLLKMWNDVVDQYAVEVGKELGSSDSEDAENAADNDISHDAEDLDGWEFSWDPTHPASDPLKTFLGTDLAHRREDAKNSTTEVEQSGSYIEEIHDENEKPAEPEVATATATAPPRPDDGLKKAKTLWKEAGDKISLTIEIPDVKKCEAGIINKRTLSFRTTDPPGYGFDLDLLRLVEEKVEVKVLGLQCKLVLTKRMKDLRWKRLTREERKMRWLVYGNDIESEDDDFSSSTENDKHLFSSKSKRKVPKKSRSYQTIDYESTDSSSSDVEEYGNPGLDEGLLT